MDWFVRRKRLSEEAYLAALESGETVAPKVTVKEIQLATRTRGFARIFQLTNSGLKELREKKHIVTSWKVCIRRGGILLV